MSEKAEMTRESVQPETTFKEQDVEPEITEVNTTKAEEPPVTESVQPCEAVRKSSRTSRKSTTLTSLSQEVKEMSRLKFRRTTIGMSGIQGVKKQEYMSTLGLEYRRPILTYAPTYQLDSFAPFKIHEVETVISNILDNTYDGHIYQVDSSSALAVSIANNIMRNTKNLLFNRYRIISVVAIGQKRAQSYTNTISFIWDKNRDSYANMQRENHTSFIQVTVFGVYLD